MRLDNWEMYEELKNKKDKIDNIIKKMRNIKMVMSTNLVINNKIPEEELINSVIERLYECSNTLSSIIDEYEDKNKI